MARLGQGSGVGGSSVVAWAMVLLLGLLAAGPGRGEERGEQRGQPPIPLRIVGFYAHAGLFAEFEEPFWT